MLSQSLKEMKNLGKTQKFKIRVRISDCQMWRYFMKKRKRRSWGWQNEKGWGWMWEANKNSNFSAQMTLNYVPLTANRMRQMEIDIKQLPILFQLHHQFSQSQEYFCHSMPDKMSIRHPKQHGYASAAEGACTWDFLGGPGDFFLSPPEATLVTPLTTWALFS